MEIRLDSALVERKLAPSREQAKVLIKNGQIMVDGKPAAKPSQPVTEDQEITVTGETLRYVSRGGLKLEKALEVFHVSVEGKTCMDIGASTGGFTDCMLQNGAAFVMAVDVGYDQLSEKLLADPRVHNMEHTNIRYLTPEELPKVPSFASIDVSFISLTKILTAVKELIAPGGDIVALIKPQFEAGRSQIGKKGVVKDPSAHKDVITAVTSFAGAIGLLPTELTYSPIRGPEGNIEYLLHLYHPLEEEDTSSFTLIDSVKIHQAVAEAFRGTIAH